MMEKPPQEIPSEPASRKDSIHFTRHSKAEYKTYRKIRESENPQAGVDPEAQITPDLSPEGVELAKQKAKELLLRFNPEEDVLFFASSNEARALETANVYREMAHQLGFKILKPEKTGTKLAGEIGEGEIRTVKNLSLNIENVLIPSLFNPDYQNKTVNWDALDPETRKKCEEVRALVREHDYGSFGANFFHYSEKASKILPEIKTAREIHETQFKNLLRLARFGIRKAREAKTPKNIKILAFGHENYMSYALDRYFEDHEIGNCETIDIRVDDSGLNIDRRGVSKTVDTE